MADAGDGRLAFDEDVENYDRWRPRYCEALFSDIVAYARLGEGKRALEIGCGTGQATEPFLKTGCGVTAVEYGPNLATCVREKFWHNPAFQVCNMEFETFSAPPASFDLIYAATSFHWISDEVGYKQIHDLLKNGGAVALFWNKPFVARGDDHLHRRIQDLYDRYALDGERPAVEAPIEHDEEKYQRRSDALKQYGFTDVECRLYRQTRKFAARDYVSLLNTYSDHRAMRLSSRLRFEEDIIAVIDEFGGVLTIYDTMDLHLGRKA